MTDSAAQSPQSAPETAGAMPVPSAPQGSQAHQVPAWAAPSRPPFGTPDAGAAPGPGYAPPAGYAAPAAGYATPAGYGQPGTYAPPAGYVPMAPQGAAAAPAPGYGYPARSVSPRHAGRGLGVAALVIAVLAVVGSSLAAAAAAFGIGTGTGREIAMQPLGTDFDWTLLTPVRDLVLLAEASFWVGTALGVWALVQGVIAIVKDRGRGFAIAAVVIAAVGPIVFFVVLWGFLAAGYGAGSGIGG